MGPGKVTSGLLWGGFNSVVGSFWIMNFMPIGVERVDSDSL